MEISDPAVMREMVRVRDVERARCAMLVRKHITAYLAEPEPLFTHAQVWLEACKIIDAIHGGERL
jgi:hypothetical protein